MKAWLLAEQAAVEEQPLELADVPVPRVNEHEIRLRTLTCGICRTDIHIIEGDLPLRKVPVIPGHEIVGIVEAVGSAVTGFRPGQRAGVFWVHSTCGHCKYCMSGRENYCPDIRCTGWDVDGGYAEYVTVPAHHALHLDAIPLSAEEIAPLMCPGIAGYAAFKLAGLDYGDRLGLYGFGPTAYYVLKAARLRQIKVYVSTRSPDHMEMARQAGAHWTGNAAEQTMPATLDAAILFPPAGELVEPILAQLHPGGTLVMAPVSSSPIHIQRYSESLWGRDIRTLYHLKMADATEFLELTDQLDARLGIQVFPFENLQEALILARQGKLAQPNAVLRVAPGPSAE